MTAASAPPARPPNVRSSPYAVPGLIGAMLATAVFLAVLLGGHFSMLRPAPFAANFYDVQAHSLLDGHWDVPTGSLFYEGFVVHGKTYEYFGPLPALLRLPVAAVTHGLDGQLGRTSMLLGFLVALTFTLRLAWRIRPLVRGSAPVRRGEQWAVGVCTFVAGAGSILVFLASRSWAYHEAELWGVALALGAFDFVIATVIRPCRRYLVLASAFTAGALLSRGPIGLGPYAALGLVVVASFWSPTRRAIGMGDPASARSLRMLALPAVLVPLALYVYVNYAKFGSLLSVPFQDQISAAYPYNQQLLAANGGSRINLKLVPTSVLQYMRPDALRIRSLFPWVTFGHPSGDIGHVVTERVGSGSYSASMPALTVLGLIGLAGIVRPPRQDGPTLAALRAPLVGGLAAAVPTLAFASLAHRYLSDFLPLGILVAVAGLHLTLRWTSRSASRVLPRVAWAGLAVLATLSLWFNTGLGIEYGRAFDAGNHDLAAFVSFQYELHDRFPGGAKPYVRTGPSLPAVADDREGTLFVVGDCDALYWSNGFKWRVLERGEGGGRYRLRVRFPTTPTGWQPLVVSGRGAAAQYLDLRMLSGSRVQVAYATVFAAKPVRVDPGRSHVLDVLMDALPESPSAGTVTVALDGKPVLAMKLPNSLIHDTLKPLTQVTIGRGDIPGVAPAFTGSLHRLPPDTPLCQKVQPDAGR